LTRQSKQRPSLFKRRVDARVEPGHDDLEFAFTPSARV
jgi:hypothetical protein